MRRTAAQCVLVFLFGLASDVLASVHIRTLVADVLLPSAAALFALHVLGFWSLAWFVDGTVAQRWAITLAGGLGSAMGTVLVIKCGW